MIHDAIDLQGIPQIAHLVVRGNAGSGRDWALLERDNFELLDFAHELRLALFGQEAFEIYRR